MEPSLKELEQALINADAAGDTESASALASEIDRIMSSPSQQQGEASWGDVGASVAEGLGTGFMWGGDEATSSA